MIELQNVSVVYRNGVKALEDVWLTVQPGEFAFIVGATGSGKSTLLKLLYREEVPTSGRVVVAGQDVARLSRKEIPYLRRKIGVVFQDFKLLPQKTVWENLAFVLRAISTPRREIRKRISEALDLVGLNGRCDSFPSQLSGGEQQRASIARALVNHPAILLADEPTGNLDPDTSWGIIQLLSEINSRGTTTLVATHNEQIVDRMRRRVIALESGRIVRDEAEGGYWSTRTTQCEVGSAE